jgi:phthalate 4,5-dioxygenase oxygenase subunit
MGKTVNRSRDTLGASDFAVVEFRRLMVDAVKNFRDGKAGPIGISDPHIPQVEISSYQGIIPKGTDWLTLGTEETEQMFLSNMGKAAS